MLTDTIFPEFVPDQVLTSADLNGLFGYLDDDGRMTRSNLVGIGIVCGLQVKTNPGKSELVITKGVGVSSEGYLLRFEHDMAFSAFKTYDAVKEEHYEKFVNKTTVPKSQRFGLWELKADLSERGSINLTAITPNLDEYLVLLFVELLKEHNKNCDPNSCDDKGTKVTVTVRPLLVSKNATGLTNLLGTTGNPFSFNPFYSLPELILPRFDVLNTHPVETEDILNGYIEIFTAGFFTRIETTLANAYQTFSSLISNDTSTNPFTDLISRFNFIHNITTHDQLIHLQYYYDIFSDLVEAYNEFRNLGNNILSTCCPSPSLFPRHLLLGEAVPLNSFSSSYRHYFIYSPLFENKNLILELKVLSTRMIEMKNNIFIPPFSPSGNASHKGIFITPSKLNTQGLSPKSIPYYYVPERVFPTWNFDKTIRGKANQNLSYHASLHNTTDEFVYAPLKYDLEGFNFLRIEGHIGKKYTEVLQGVDAIKKNYRLPIDVIALSTGVADISKITDGSVTCNLRDLQSNYEIIRREWEAIIGKMIEYLNDQRTIVSRMLTNLDTDQNIFTDYLVLLNKAKPFMVPDLMEFITNYDKFLVPVYEEVEYQSQRLRDYLSGIIKSPGATKDTITIREDPQVVEDIIDHFDEVILSCLKGGFRSIFQQFNSRVNEIYNYMFFYKFAEKHPGIQHKAGVPMGGTFVIVYHKKPFSGLKGPFTISGTVRTTKGAVVSNGLVYVADTNTNVSAILNADGVFSIVVNKLPAVIKVFKYPTFELFRYVPPLTGEILVNAPGNPVLITVPSGPVIVDDEQKGVYNSLQDDEVIADFYLPYICSSNCLPIQFNVQEKVNFGPVANAGNNQAFSLPKNSTILDGRASYDPETKPLQFLWKFVSDQEDVIISDPTSAQPAVVNLNQPGEYIFTLTVTDEEGIKSHSDQVTVTVKPEPDQAPVANAGEDQVIKQPANTVVLNGEATDPGDKSVSVEWSLVEGPSGAIFEHANAAQTAVSNLTEKGSYIFKFTVTNVANLSASDEVMVTVVEADNEGPIAIASGTTEVILPDTFAILDASQSFDPEGFPISFLWENAGAELSIINHRSQRPIVFDLNEENTYKLKLTVTDNIGLTGSDDIEINVTGKWRDDCKSLQSIYKNLIEFRESGSPDLDEFIGAYKPFNELMDYLKRVDEFGIENDTRSQLDFFANHFFTVAENGESVQVNIVSALTTWLKPLFELIQVDPMDTARARKAKEGIRTVGMQLYILLMDFALYMNCIQDSFKESVLNTERLFELLAEQNRLLDPSFVKALTTEQLILLIQMKTMVEVELKLIQSRQQEEGKADYIQILKGIQGHLGSILTS